jgi:hypothetical protein
MLPCQHSFSEKTIGKWMQKNSSCPTCSAPAQVKDIRPNYELRDKLKEKQKVLMDGTAWSI